MGCFTCQLAGGGFGSRVSRCECVESWIVAQVAEEGCVKMSHWSAMPSSCKLSNASMHASQQQRAQSLSKRDVTGCMCCCRYSVLQKFGRHIDDSVEIQGSPGHVTGYTLLIYLSGSQQQPGPIDPLAPRACATHSSSSPSSQPGSKAKRQKQQGPAAATAGSLQAPTQINANAVQQLVGGETVFYGGCRPCDMYWKGPIYMVTGWHVST
jgi:hypothetical protein